MIETVLFMAAVAGTVACTGAERFMDGLSYVYRTLLCAAGLDCDED